jgi:hypothetical protein
MEDSTRNYLQFAALWIDCKSMSISDHARAAKRSYEVVQALCLLLASLATFAFAAYPIYVIRPFTEQAPAVLGRALRVLLYDRPLSLVLAFLITTLAFFLWRRSGLIHRRQTDAIINTHFFLQNLSSLR